MVDIVPTKTSRAAKLVIKAIPIFQSKPSGSIAGSMARTNNSGIRQPEPVGSKLGRKVGIRFPDRL